jgi:hypothetical protein
MVNENMEWWREDLALDAFEEALAMMDASVGASDDIDRCDTALSALNRLVTGFRATRTGQPEGDEAALTALMLSAPPERLETFIHSDALQSVSALVPLTGDEHRDALIHKCASLLFSVRNNIKHGEKPPLSGKVIAGLLEAVFTLVITDRFHHLAAYGSFRVGQPSHLILKGWTGPVKGSVAGTLIDLGAALPSLSLGTWRDPEKQVPVEIFRAPSAAAWSIVDRFEGNHYTRRSAWAFLEDERPLPVQVYIGATEGTPRG